MVALLTERSPVKEKILVKGEFKFQPFLSDLFDPVDSTHNTQSLQVSELPRIFQLPERRVTHAGKAQGFRVT